jgi:hypothetical protein
MKRAGDAMQTPYSRAPADAAAQALDRYRCAQATLDRVTRLTDWRQSAVAPAVILQPLVDAVTRARADCLALGVTPDGAVTHR